MKTWQRRGLWATLGLAILVGGGGALGLQAGESDPASAATVSAATVSAATLNDPARIERGRYLAAAGDCAACHTARNGKPYAGGRMLSTPFGDVYAPNITPDDATGIGRWTFADFWRALHEGKGQQGQPLYPVFSYTSFTKVTRADALDLYAYLRSLRPVTQPNQPHELKFPYSLRKGLYLWRALYFDPGVYQPDPEQSKQWNRGAYLVQGLGHCNECHTTRSALGAMNTDEPLSGGAMPAQGWYAPDLSTATGGGLEGWTQADIVQLLKTGQSRRGAVFGPMADVVRNSTQHLSHADLTAIAVYLQSLPARPQAATAVTAKAADYGQGQAIYKQHCAACHGNDGGGVDSIYPPLEGNIVVTEPTGINAIRSVLLGGFPPATKGNPAPYSMPPYARQLNDADIAAVVNYIRQSWANHASPVTAKDVAKYRYADTD